MKFNRIFIVAAALVGLVSCEIDDAAKIELVELGAVQKTYTVEAEESLVDIEVYSNGPFHIERFGDESTWLTLSAENGSGDQVIKASCTYNEEFKRAAGLVLCSDVDARRDTLYVKQKGMKTATISMENTSVIAAGKEGDTSVKVRTNVPFDYMTVTKEYNSETDTTWIKNVVINSTIGSDDADMVFSLNSNPDDNVPRTATVTFTFVDGWMEAVSVAVNLVQRNAKEGLGRVVTFQEFKDKYTTGKPVSEYVILEGIVISNKDGGNAGENEQTTTSAIDYTGCKRTIYLEALDGSAGVCLTTKTADDNSVKQYDKIQVLLYGVTPVLKENPDRVDINGVTKAMIVSQIAGKSTDVPVKEKYIRDLADSDIYTFVTLKDVEFPIRKSSICPVNEGYTIGTNANRLSKYPLLTRDINGDVTYMMTNTNCMYRSDGTRLPYGSGKISGVIVHERFSRFEWRNAADPLDMDDDPTLGFISRYQIRHQNKADIWSGMQDSVENGFSALLTEYRYWNPDVDNMVQRPTYGTNGWLDHTYQEKYSADPTKFYLQSAYKQHMWGAGTYEYLGPGGNNANYLFGLNTGNKNGIGVVIDPAKEHYNSLMSDFISTNPDGTIEWCGQYASNKYAGYGAQGWSQANADAAAYINAINYSGSTSMCGKCNVSGNCYTAFGSNFWWDDQTNRPYGWLINFSTKGISTNHLSMQISVMNTQQTWYSPRFWKAEWAYTDAQDAAHDSEWHLIGEYTVPDVSVWSNTLYSSIVAYKYVNFELPLEILDQDNVYIRLVPTSDLCSDGADYANARLKDHSSGTALSANHASALEYFAIRYNK